MLLNCSNILILFIFLCANMYFVYSDNINQNSKSLDVMSKSNVLKKEFPNVHEQSSLSTYLDVRKKENLLKKLRHRRKSRNEQFIHKREKHNLNSIHIHNLNQKHAPASDIPLQDKNVLLIRKEKILHDIPNSPSQAMNIESEFSKKATGSNRNIQNPSRNFLETQVAKKSLNPLEEVPSQETKLSVNEQQKTGPCTNKLGCKQKSRFTKRENYANLQSNYAGGDDYELLPKVKSNENIIIDVKNDTFKDNSDKNSTALLQEIVAQLNDIRENSRSYTSLNHGLTCIINGHWKSEIGGMSLNITAHNYTYGNSTNQNLTGPLVVDLYESSQKIPSINHPVLNSNWSLIGYVPHVRNETLTLTAENMISKHVAVFIGQCRVCEGSELITGQWLIHYNVKDCRHIQTSQMVRGDIFKRIPVKSEETQLHKE